jgi:hypothetical protein
MADDASTESAKSQFDSMDVTKEIALHLPFPDSEDPLLPQPYAAAPLTWPLSAADFHALERHAAAGNRSALNNLGTQIVTRDLQCPSFIAYMCCDSVGVVHLFGWCGQPKDECKALGCFEAAAVPPPEDNASVPCSVCGAAKINEWLCRYLGLGCRATFRAPFFKGNEVSEKRGLRPVTLAIVRRT